MRAVSCRNRQGNPRAGGWAVLLVLAFGAAAPCTGEDAAPESPYSPLALSTNDRVLVLAPHPDDEVIACGGVIQRAVAKHVPVHVAFLTYGDNNEWSFLLYRGHAVILPSAVRQMGLLRHDEAIRADGVLGLAQDALTFLGYPDFGALRIWTQHWEGSPPFASMLTRVTRVPYANAFRTGAEYKGEEVLRDLTSLLRSFRPTRVFVSHPADFNPDHRALYLFTRIALWDLESEMAPALHPYLVHFPKWPERRGFHPSLALDAPDVLSRQTAWQELQLTEAEIGVKRESVTRHKTQYEYAAGYLLSFVRSREIFGDLPPVACSPANPVHDLSAGQRGQRGSAEPDDPLTEEEQARFVGLECRKLQLDAASLTLVIELSRPLGEAVAADVQFFGYRQKVPFGRMPKIWVRIGHVEHAVMDQGTVLSDSGVVVARAAHDIRVTVPLALLGKPERLLVSARTHLGEVPLDWAAWRIIETDTPRAPAPAPRGR